MLTGGVVALFYEKTIGAGFTVHTAGHQVRQTSYLLLLGVIM
jgi:hypothetical protein